MEKIQQAIQFAKQNPDSTYATELRRRIEGGQLDKELSRAGLSESYGRPYIPTLGEKVVGNAKAALGGVASGVGGAILTAQDILGRKIVNALPENTTIAGVTKQQMQQNLANAPKLQEQLKKEFGGDTYNSASEVGQVAGEIATLAAPVGAIGKTIQKATKSVGGSNLVSKLAQAGAEGVAFTAGQGVIRNEKQSLNDFALNAGLNMVFPAAGSVAKKVGENAPARIINSLIKPLQKDFAYGKNPGRTVAELGITANDFDGLITGIKNAKTSVGENIGTLTQKALPQLQSQMDLNTYLTPIDEALAIANKSPRTNATVISRLESVKADLVDNVNRGIDPQSFKGLVGDLTRWTGNASDDAIVNKALKQVYGKTSSGMDTVLKDTLSPEEFVQYKKNAEQYGDLISAENAAVYRDSIVKRQDLVSFGAKNSALITAVAAAASSGGSGLGTILAGLGGAVLDKAMATPAFKTRLASLLTKLAPKDINTFFDKIPVAKTLYRQEQIEDIIKTAKKNYKGQMNKGMVNFSEIKKTFTPSKTITNDISKAKASGQSFDEWVKKGGEIRSEAKKYKLNPDNIEYHGTGKKFDEFLLGEEGSSGAGTQDFGVFTTKSKEAAKFWAEKSAGVGKDGNVMSVYLDIKNPKVFKTQKTLDNFLGDNPEIAINKLKSQGFDSIKYPESGIDKFPFDYWDELASKGVRFKNQLPDEPYMTTQVFDPKNIHIIKDKNSLKNIAENIQIKNKGIFGAYPDLKDYKPEDISLLTNDRYIQGVLEHYSKNNKTNPAETIKQVRSQLKAEWDKVK